MPSDAPDRRHHSQPLLCRLEPWEFIQQGTCGSPLETPEGWLMLTHGAGVDASMTSPPQPKECSQFSPLLSDPARLLFLCHLGIRLA
jgi:hypothetical protein